jgi:hypothetical protein
MCEHTRARHDTDGVLASSGFVAYPFAFFYICRLSVRFLARALEVDSVDYPESRILSPPVFPTNLLNHYVSPVFRFVCVQGTLFAVGLFSNSKLVLRITTNISILLALVVALVAAEIALSHALGIAPAVLDLKSAEAPL